MLESIFQTKTIKELETARELLERDLAITKKAFLYLAENKNICVGILTFGVKGDDVKKLVENVLNIEHLLQSGRTIEIKSIAVLENILKTSIDKNIRQELNSLLALLQEQKAIWEEMLALDAELKQKKYAIKPMLVLKIRRLLEKQMQCLATNEPIINKITGNISESETKIKEIITRTYGRTVSKERADKMRDTLLLSETNQLVPCFILTSKLLNLIGSIETKRKELINIFKSVGTEQIERIILFEIDKSQDLSVLLECPAPKPQKVDGLIEQKFPGRTRIKIIRPVYSV